MTQNDNKNAIVISYDWPGDHGGHPIGCKSCLAVYGEVFSQIHYLCISDRQFSDPGQWGDLNVDWIFIPRDAEAKWLRFTKSLFSRLPAITVRYTQVAKVLFNHLEDVISRDESNGRDVCIILEGIPLACFLPEICRRFANVPVALNSHDMVSRGFESFVAQAPLIQKLPWVIEVHKIKKFEKSACELADRVWAITNFEATEYLNRLSVRVDGVFSRSIPAEHYAGVRSGDVNTVVHVGSADLRKGIGLKHFVQQTWPAVREKVPHARLVLAGRGTERFADERLGIEGLGFVGDDRDVLGRGLIFINPQHIGSGLQLKSLVAMLSGKALLSTRKGVEGIDGKDGEHFCVADSSEEMINRMDGLMNDKTLAERLGRNARTLASRVHSHDYVTRAARPLVKELANLKVGSG